MVESIIAAGSMGGGVHHINQKHLVEDEESSTVTLRSQPIRESTQTLIAEALCHER